MKEYCVYEHVFPNGKKYIGITCDAKLRWKDGKGYDAQPKMKRAIEYYGWENIEHNIIVDGIEKEQAEQLEQYLIAELNTFSNGYNSTIGGNTVGGYYLNEEILYKLRAIKEKYPEYYEWEVSKGLIEFMNEAKTDKSKADFVNEASRAVQEKHGEYGANVDDLDCYFYYMSQYFDLSYRISTGQDVSNWKEKSLNEALAEAAKDFFSGNHERAQKAEAD